MNYFSSVDRDVKKALKTHTGMAGDPKVVHQKTMTSMKKPSTIEKPPQSAQTQTKKYTPSVSPNAVKSQKS